jgi:predicted dienelactone hydrolase
MKAETETKIKYGVWGLILGAGAAAIIGFSWGGWTTRSTAQAQSDATLLATRAAICVAQFTKASNNQQTLKDLKATNSWERASFIEKGGWDKMPGEEKAIDTVSQACANGLGPLIEK